MWGGAAPRSGVRRVLDNAADRMLDHPGPSTAALQRTVMLCLIDATFTGFRWGKRLWPR